MPLRCFSRVSGAARETGISVSAISESWHTNIYTNIYKISANMRLREWRPRKNVGYETLAENDRRVLVDTFDIDVSRRRILLW